ncbi:MAG: peptidoglycan-associated lipoprotein [Thiomicrorhabdus sp.]|nr:MAG: peptidoglycan-associated lipoprotein [Thiomicrorhabdus sp.]
MIQLKSLFALAVVASLAACSSTPGREGDSGRDTGSDPEVTVDTAPGLEGRQSGVQVLSAEQRRLAASQNAAAAHRMANMVGDQPDVVVSFEPVVYFALDQYELDDEDLETVKYFSHRMLESYQLQVKIKGHTDERGTPEYNLALGEKRAKSVAEAMMLFGVSESRIEVISYGEEQPVDAGNNEAAWQKNRRVNLLIQ